MAFGMWRPEFSKPIEVVLCLKNKKKENLQSKKYIEKGLYVNQAELVIESEK